MGDCRKIQVKLRDYVQGDVTVELGREVEAHLKECATCREAYKEEVELSSLLEDFSQEAKSSFISSRSEIMSKIDKNRYGNSLWKRVLYAIGGGGWKHAVNALVIAAIVFVGVAFVRGGTIGLAGKGRIEITPIGEASEDLDMAISNYLTRKSSEGFAQTDAWFEAHKILGQQEKNGTTRVYLYAMFMGFNLEDKKFREAAGKTGPVVVELKKNEDGKYGVTGYKRPGDGSQYAKDIKGMFPEDIAEKALDAQEIKLALGNDINRQAIDWLKAQHKETATIDRNYCYFELPEKIKVFKGNVEFTITQGSPLFNEILYLTAMRFDYNNLGGYRRTSSSIYENISKEDTILVFNYSQRMETNYRIRSGELYKANYYSLYMPLTGNDNKDKLAFKDGNNDQMILGDLKYSKELMELVNSLNTGTTEVGTKN